MNKTTSFLSVTGILLISLSTLAATYLTVDYNPDRPLAMVRRFKPDVIIKDNNEWIEARKAQPLFSSDTLRTGKDGHAVVQFMDNSIARLKPYTELVITGNIKSANSTSARMAVEAGEIFLNVTGQQSDYAVITPTGVAAVKGTSFITKVEADGSTSFTGLSGMIEVTATNSGDVVNITRRDRAHIDQDGNTISVTQISEEELDNMEKDNEEIDDVTTPKKMKLRFRNSDGQVREIEIDYFEND
ncbi:MAG: FecR family protein [Balneolales bacterium]